MSFWYFLSTGFSESRYNLPKDST